MIRNGDLGEIRGFRGIHAEDYMASSDRAFTWRHDPEGGGAVADLGSNIIATAEFLLGPISKVLGNCVTSIDKRKDLSGKIHNVVLRDMSGEILNASVNLVAMMKK